MVSRHTGSQPVLVDNSLYRFLALKYVIYAAFGISGVLTHVPSIALVAGEAVASTLSAVVGISSAVAAVSAWNALKGGVWVRRELFSTIVMVSFVAVYNVSLIYLAVAGVGNRINLAIIASALLVMPVWRIRDILRNSRRP